MYFIIIIIFCFQISLTQEIPTLKNYVNDECGFLSQSEKNNLEKFLNEYDRKTSNQIIVLTIPSLNGESIENFSISVVEKNKIGVKGKDNGVLILIVKDIRKVRIESGYGLEGVLTDAKSSMIIHNLFVPNFKSGNYYLAISESIKEIVNVIGDEHRGEKKSFVRKNFKLLFVIVIFVAFFLQGIFSRRKNYVYSSSGYSRFGGGPFVGGFGGGGFGGFGGGGFSGGGGSFGGGGASGSW